MQYLDFLNAKKITVVPSGIDDPPDLHDRLFDFQRDITRWALRLGKAAIWAGTGLGKSAMAIEWSRVVNMHTGKPVLILTPLAVADQFVDEGKLLDVEIVHAREMHQVGNITVTNYERLHKFDTNAFGGVVLDESSCLRDYTSKTRNQLIREFEPTPFRLCCSATPAPNDYMELGNHAEFLGTMTRAEMLAMFFIHDGGETQKWRLKGHAESDFWAWLASWAVNLTHPRDLGYDERGYDLPELNTITHFVTVDTSAVARDQGLLFASDARSLSEQRAAKRTSLDERVRMVSEMVNASSEPWIIWCQMNNESSSLSRAITDAIEVTGSMSLDEKEARLGGFTSGNHRVMVSKPSIAGWGLNWQHCHNVCFAGIDYSFEAMYQAIRRCWRFGQKHPVNVHMVLSEQDQAVLDSLQRKEADAERLTLQMVSYMAPVTRATIGQTTRTETRYTPITVMVVPSWLQTDML